MEKLNSLSIKFKVIFNVILSFIVIGVVVVVLNYNKSQDELLQTAEKDFKNFQELFYRISKSQASGLTMALENIMNDKKVVQMFENEEREALADYLVPLFNNSLKPVYNIKQFQFHIPKATSFLRLHKPSKFGDDLSAFRGTVVYTNENKKSAVGIEVGRGGPGLRVVLPVFGSKGQHLGSVEFGGGLTSILKEISSLFKVDYSIGIKQNVFEKARRFKGKDTDIKKDEITYYEYSSDSAHKHTKQMPRVSIDRVIIDGNLATYSFPIYDFLDNIVGYVSVFADLTEKKAEINKQITKFIISIAIFMLVASTLMVLLLRIAINPLNEFIHVLDGLTDGDTGGDLTQRLTAKHKDEVGKASSSINKFIELTMVLIQDIKGKSKTALELGESVDDLSRNIHQITIEQRSLLGRIDDKSTKVKTQATSSKDSTDETLKAILHEAKLISRILTGLTLIRDSMSGISSDETKLAEEVGELTKEVAKIKNITELIDSISDQTNLLALNASIEAARAGQHGRGFSVVAEEIHTLSTETQNALGQIDEKIEALVDIVDGLSKRILGNSKSIDTLGDNIQNTFKEANTLLTTSENTVRTSEVSRVSSENIISLVVDLNNDVRDALRITDKNDETSQKLAKVASRMSQAMGELRDKMALFKTEEDNKKIDEYE